MNELAKTGRKSHQEVIQDYFGGKVSEEELSNEQETYLKMVQLAYGQMMEVKSRKYIVNCLKETYLISQSYAYKIIREAQVIFSDVYKINKDINRHIAIEMAKQTYRMAKKKGNTYDMGRAAMAFIKAAGLDKEDADLPDFSKLQASLLVAVLPDGLEESIANILKGGVVDLNKVEDIEHEEITEPTDQGSHREAPLEGQE